MIGIDFGTTNSAVAVADEFGHVTTARYPSGNTVVVARVPSVAEGKPLSGSLGLICSLLGWARTPVPTS